MVEPHDELEDLVAQAFHDSFLRGLPAEARPEILDQAVHTEVPAHRVLYKEGGRPVPSLVVSGLFRQFVTGPDDRQVSVFYARSGHLLGFAEALDGPSPLACQAVTDGYLLRFSAPAMAAFSAVQPELAVAIARQTLTRLYRLVGEVRSTAFGSVRQRIARHLLDLVAGQDADLIAPVNYQELADAVGTVREVIGREVAPLRAKGLVATTPEGIAVLDPIGLRAVGWPDG